MPTDDIEVHHEGGRTVVRGIEVDALKKFHGEVRAGGGKGSIELAGISQIDRIRADGSPHQTIYGGREREGT